METFQEKFCQARKCPAETFDRKVFWACLHRRAIPFAPFFLLFRPAHFAADWELIAAVRGAKNTGEIWEQIGKYFANPKHAGWLRGSGDVRLSAQRLIVLAGRHIPSSGRPPRVDLPEF
jgi:hypothetical protein